ncbi:MAG TPA: carbohydrate ABC transporter permease, partial [Actinomycetota bacterium]
MSQDTIEPVRVEPILPPLQDDEEVSRRRFLFSGWHLVLLPMALVMIVPLVWMFVTSIETLNETRRFPPVLVPA